MKISELTHNCDSVICAAHLIYGFLSVSPTSTNSVLSQVGTSNNKLVETLARISPAITMMFNDAWSSIGDGRTIEDSSFHKANITSALGKWIGGSVLIMGDVPTLDEVLMKMHEMLVDMFGIKVINAISVNYVLDESPA